MKHLFIGIKKKFFLHEQNWINELKPEYILNHTAGNSKGYTHTLEAKIKKRSVALDKKHYEDVKRSMS
jgi:hypothetical protein